MDDQKPKRQRLTPKQRQFLHLVYDCNIPINNALNDLRIRVLTFERWLHKPVFVNRLRMYITQYYLEARLEMARSAPSAISGLTLASQKSRNYTDLNRACKEILNFHTQFAKITAGIKNAKNADNVDSFGALWAQLGASLAQNGAVLDPPRIPKSEEKPLLNAKNADISKKPGKPGPKTLNKHARSKTVQSGLAGF